MKASLELSTALQAQRGTLTRGTRSLWGDAWRRLLSNRSARVGMGVVIFLLVLALVGIAVPYNARIDSDLSNRLNPPSAHQWFGTDDQGRDVFNRVIHGAPYSLTVGLGSVLLAWVLGSTLGTIAGFRGRWVDALTMRAMDITLAFPSTLLAIAIVAVRGPGLNNTMLAIGVVNIPVYARLARASTLAVKQMEYIVAAQCIGASAARTIWRHILPNALSPLIVQGTLGIATAILEAAALGFLGLGAQPPAPEWGAMLADGYKYLTTGSWWVLLFPGLAIMLTVLGFNLLGDGLRDALDVRVQAD